MSGQYSVCFPSLPPFFSSCRFFLMHLIKKPETEFTGQVHAVLACSEISITGGGY